MDVNVVQTGVVCAKLEAVWSVKRSFMLAAHLGASCVIQCKIEAKRVGSPLKRRCSSAPLSAVRAKCAGMPGS